MKTPKLKLSDTQRQVLKHLSLSPWYLDEIQIGSQNSQQKMEAIDQLVTHLSVSAEEQKNDLPSDLLSNGTSSHVSQERLDDVITDAKSNPNQTRLNQTKLNQKTSSDVSVSKILDESNEPLSVAESPSDISCASSSTDNKPSIQLSERGIQGETPDKLPINVSHLIDNKVVQTANPRNKHLLVKPLSVYAEDTHFIEQTPVEFQWEVSVDERFKQNDLARQKIAADYELSLDQINLNALSSDCDEMIVCYQKEHVYQDGDSPSTTHLSPQQNLLDNLLSVCQIQLSNCYVSYLNKSTQPQLHEANQLVEHLKQEMAQIKPKRLWIFGGETVQSILGINHPLGYLINKETQNQSMIQLTCLGHDAVNQFPIELLVFPDLNYLLAMPKDKAIVWQYIKRHILN